jgi:aryl-alcohol dehydrogenase-like predicted oxidoreductase
MRYSLLGRTGVKVSCVSLGTMAFGGDATPEASAAILNRAREGGINFFDTADVYTDGRSEEILGGLLREWRNEAVIATKAYFPTGKDPNARGSSR